MGKKWTFLRAKAHRQLKWERSFWDFWGGWGVAWGGKVGFWCDIGGGGCAIVPRGTIVRDRRRMKSGARGYMGQNEKKRTESVIFA
jgi:hypothetical protein